VIDRPLYREVIKKETNKLNRKRFCRRLILIGLSCTLGCGALGFAAGSAYHLVKRYYLQEDEKEIKNMKLGFTLDYSQADITGRGLSDIVAMVEPSVVSLEAVAKYTNDFFGIQAPFQNNSIGSGIIFGHDANRVFIITNHHVVENADKIYMSQNGYDRVSALLIGSDQQADLAVVGVRKSDLVDKGYNGLAIAVFGDSDSLQVGEKVLAIGNAAGMGNTATGGIISAIDRVITVSNRELTVIQTDTAINEGNSGGPLINTKGEVVGINTAKVNWESVEGMGYSISANVCKPIVDNMMKRLTAPFLGIYGYTITAEDAESYNVPQIGVVVKGIYKGTSADNSGIQPFDIIIGIDDENIFTMDQLSESIQGMRIGQKINIRLIRNGKSITIDVTLGTYTESELME